MKINKLFVPLPSLHPLLYIACAFIFGICWQSNEINLSLLYFLVASCFIIAHFSTQMKTRFYQLAAATCITFFAAGFVYNHQQTQFHQWLMSFQEPIDVIATITDISPCSTKNYAFVTTASIERVHTTDYTNATDWQTTPYQLMIYTKKKPAPLVQDRIFLSSIKISKPTKESWHKYALKKGIGGSLFCNKLKYHHLSRPTWSWRRWLWSVRQSLSQRLLNKMSQHTASYFALLFMGTHRKGKKSSESLRDTFQIWGILHYLARSGLHMVIFILIWQMLLLVVPCSYRFREAILLLLSCIYFLLSWPSLSFVRAFATYLLYKISGLFSHRTNTLHILTVITLFFLMVNPIHLFCLDFQLSFGLTFALAWLQNNNYAWNSSTNP